MCAALAIGGNMMTAQETVPMLTACSLKFTLV